MIDVENVFFDFEGQSILRKVSFQAKRGEFIGIMGPNGGGKTTLLKLLMGFLQPRKGKITLNGKNPREARCYIGYVPQTHRSDRDFPITLLELVLLGAVSQTNWMGAYPKAVKERALELIEELGLMAHRDQPFGALSGGLAQRALLARALLSDPDILLLDEATANIDTASLQIFFRLLEQMKEKKTILLVTHDLHTIVERVDRVLSVQREVHSYLPQQICEHFALGLYHTPLLDLPQNHFAQGPHAPSR
jgi:zinc transport system ATP-binding protein